MATVRKSRRPRDPKWAALRQWHRGQAEAWSAAAVKWRKKRYESAADYCRARGLTHAHTLEQMTRLARKHGRQETK